MVATTARAHISCEIERPVLPIGWYSAIPSIFIQDIKVSFVLQAPRLELQYVGQKL